jgi:hypothetical protein
VAGEPDADPDPFGGTAAPASIVGEPARANASARQAAGAPAPGTSGSGWSSTLPPVGVGGTTPSFSMACPFFTVTSNIIGDAPFTRSSTNLGRSRILYRRIPVFA